MDRLTGTLVSPSIHLPVHGTVLFVHKTYLLGSQLCVEENLKQNRLYLHHKSRIFTMPNKLHTL